MGPILSWKFQVNLGRANIPVVMSYLILLSGLCSDLRDFCSQNSSWISLLPMISIFNPMFYSGALYWIGQPGLPGNPGQDGNPGVPGESGLPGEPGENGIPGTNSTSGLKGEPGSSGSPGYPGSPGAPGIPGLIGAPGQKGDPGAAGLNGVQGPQGLTGVAGPPGDVGPAGYPGRDSPPTANRQGSVYTRWGRKTCAANSTLIYEGSKNFGIHILFNNKNIQLAQNIRGPSFEAWQIAFRSWPRPSHCF